MIKITNLNKSFGSKRVLENLNCNIKTGTIYGLIGANGAGKSTLLRIIMSIFKADSRNNRVGWHSIKWARRINAKISICPRWFIFL